MNEQELFELAGGKIADAEKSQMFGKPCFKVLGKAFACFYQNCMVFKLPEEVRTEALHLSGSVLFDPSGKGRPMKEWVQVTAEHSDQWAIYAQAAYGYVSGIGKAA